MAEGNGAVKAEGDSGGSAGKKLTFEEWKATIEEFIKDKGPLVAVRKEGFFTVEGGLDQAKWNALSEMGRAVGLTPQKVFELHGAAVAGLLKFAASLDEAARPGVEFVARRLEDADPGKGGVPTADDVRAGAIALAAVRVFVDEFVKVPKGEDVETVDVGCIHAAVTKRLVALPALSSVDQAGVDAALKEALGEELYPLAALINEGLLLVHAPGTPADRVLTVFRGAKLTKAEYEALQKSAEQTILLPAFTSWSVAQGTADKYPRVAADAAQDEIEVIWELETIGRGLVDEGADISQQELVLPAFSAVEVLGVSGCALKDEYGRDRVLVVVQDVGCAKLQVELQGTKAWMWAQLEEEKVKARKRLETELQAREAQAKLKQPGRVLPRISAVVCGVKVSLEM